MLLLASGLAVIWCLAPTCENEILAEYPSPDGKSKAIVFMRNCGATTEFNTQVSLLPAKEQLGTRPGNTVIADMGRGGVPSGPHGGPEVNIQWIDLATVTIAHSKNARIFRADTEAGGIRVQYRHTDP